MRIFFDHRDVSRRVCHAALLILLANVFDGVDGYVARLTRTTSQFGVEFDSLADVSLSASRQRFWVIWLFALQNWVGWRRLPMWCVRARLSRFNVQAQDGEESFRRSADSAAAQMIPLR